MWQITHTYILLVQFQNPQTIFSNVLKVKTVPALEFFKATDTAKQIKVRVSRGERSGLIRILCCRTDRSVYVGSVHSVLL